MLNQVHIMGRLTRDPELRRTGSGIAVTGFTVAVDRDWVGENQERETDFIDCVAWRSTGEFLAKYFNKGQMIVVSGRLQVRAWTDKDGNKRRSTEVNVENCYFGGGKLTDGSAPDAELPIAGNVSTQMPVPASDFAELQEDDL